MLNDAELQILIAATYSSTSTPEMFSQLNRYTMFTFQLTDVAVIALYRSALLHYIFKALYHNALNLACSK